MLVIDANFNRSITVAHHNCGKEVQKKVDALKKSLKEAKDCKCKRLLDDNRVTDQVLSDAVYEVTCHPDNLPTDTSKSQSDSGQTDPDDKLSSSSSTRKSCGGPTSTIVHELRHAGDDGIVHPTPELKRLFEDLEECLNPDGTLKVKCARH